MGISEGGQIANGFAFGIDRLLPALRILARLRDKTPAQGRVTPRRSEDYAGSPAGPGSARRSTEADNRAGGCRHVHAVGNGHNNGPTALDGSPAHDRYLMRLRRSTILAACVDVAALSPAFCRTDHETLKPPPLGSTSSSRWIVLASKPVASVIRFAARPVGRTAEGRCPSPRGCAEWRRAPTRVERLGYGAQPLGDGHHIPCRALAISWLTSALRVATCRILRANGLAWPGLLQRRGYEQKIKIFLDPDAQQHILGHASITNTVRYTVMSPEPFKDIWRGKR